MWVNVSVQIDQDFTWTRCWDVELLDLGGDLAGFVVDACFVLLWDFCRHVGRCCISGIGYSCLLALVMQ